ncbi:hypothetical protein DFH94DRAFT_770716, partial [Russula ochroleuca]
MVSPTRRHLLYPNGAPHTVSTEHDRDSRRQCTHTVYTQYSTLFGPLSPIVLLFTVYTVHSKHRTARCTCMRLLSIYGTTLMLKIHIFMRRRLWHL